MLIIQPLSGLANRMRAIDSACSLAKAIDRPLGVAWNRGPDLGAEFFDLFEPVDGLNFVRMDQITLRHPTVIISQDRITELMKANFDFESLHEYSTIIIRTWDRFYHSNDPYSLFVPTPILRQNVARLTARFDETIGVHIRRTDNKLATENSPTTAYVGRMQMAVDTKEARTFFLATDDPAEERALRKIFEGRILTHEKRSLDRSQRIAIEDAVIDLYALAATRRLLGSYWSSFSFAAAAIGRIDLETVRA